MCSVPRALKQPYLHQCGDREAESQSDFYDVRRIQSLKPNGAAAADEQQHGGAQELGGQHSPYLVLVGYVVHRYHTVYNCKTKKKPKLN